MSLPEDDDQHVTKGAMKNEIVTLLGGRVAEHVVLDDISTGASNDLERATAIARSMVTKYGFSDKLGPVVYGSGHDEVFLGRDFTQSRNYSEEIANLIDTEIRTIVEDAYAECESILKAHMDKLHEVTQCLLEQEKLDSDDFKKIMDPSYVPAFSGKPAANTTTPVVGNKDTEVVKAKSAPETATDAAETANSDSSADSAKE